MLTLAASSVAPSVAATFWYVTGSLPKSALASSLTGVSVNVKVAGSLRAPGHVLRNLQAHLGVVVGAARAVHVGERAVFHHGRGHQLPGGVALLVAVGHRPRSPWPRCPRRRQCRGFAVASSTTLGHRVGVGARLVVGNAAEIELRGLAVGSVGALTATTSTTLPSASWGMGVSSLPGVSLKANSYPSVHACPRTPSQAGSRPPCRPSCPPCRRWRKRGWRRSRRPRA